MRMEVVAGVITTITIAKPRSSSSSSSSSCLLLVRRLPLDSRGNKSSSRAATVVVPNRERARRTKTITPKCLYVSSSPQQPMPPPPTTTPKWAQRTITLPPLPRGCHLITPQIVNGINTDLSDFNCGLAHLFLQHTSASLTINENYDSDVRHDTETFLNNIVPEGPSAPWRHTLEGPDDMPAHVKSSMFGCDLTIPITQGKLNMGTWQGIWLCEHRDYATARKLVVTLNGI